MSSTPLALKSKKGGSIARDFIICGIDAQLYSAFSLGLVQVYSLSDISGGSYTPGTTSTDLSFTTNFCVLEVSLLGPFRLTFTSANASGTSFRVKNGLGNYYLPYTLTYYPAANGTGTGYTMSSGVASGSFTVLSLGVCFQNSLKVTFLNTNLQTARAGSYSDTVQIFVEAI